VELQLPDRYQLDPDPILGEGGMGRVLRARDVQLNLPVALKIVRPDLAADVRFRKLFDLEVRISARFTHPNIVPLHDLGELGDGTPYLGLALADAGSFANFHQEGIEWPELLRLTTELLDALSHLHARDVLHRDLKPENVLLYTGEDGLRHVWLADLGLANASKSLARKKGRMEGTPGFMAPEQKLGQPREFGPWTDLYSLGVILWELVTERLPFPEGQCALDAPLQPLTSRHDLDLPEGLELVLANLLTAEPLSRYDTAADLRTELLALGQAQPHRGVRIRVQEDLVGTVATSVPLPTFSDSGSMSRSLLGSSHEMKPQFDGGATMVAFDFDDLKKPDAGPAESFVQTIPFWNRPKPPPMPEAIPVEAGLGVTARASPRLSAIRELPVVARDSYRQQLWTLAREVAQQRKPQVVLLVGEAGSGKTCIVDSVVRTLREGGWAESVEMTFQRPPGKEDGYAGAARTLIRPWNESRGSLTRRLRRELARSRGAMDGVVWEEADVLAKWCGLLDEGEEPVPAGYGLREVYRYLESRAWRGLACMVMDNAEWAVEDGDGLSIAEAILQTSEEGQERPILVFVTMRGEDLQDDATLRERVDALVVQGATRIELPRLNRDETLILLRESLRLTPDLETLLASRCAGNPLFARQLLIEWTDRGWLEDKGGLHFGLVQGVDINAAIPADAEALFLGRVSALAGRSGNERRFRDTVHLAALAGGSMPKDLFAIMAGPELEDYARGCGIWVEKDDLFRFDHVLLHHTLLAQAEGRKDATYLHRRLARSWQKFGETTGVNVDLECGRHGHAGRDWRFAVTHLLAASQRAFRRGRVSDLEQASSMLLSACEADERVAEQLGWATIWRGRSFEVHGKNDEARDAFNRALALHEKLEDSQGIIESLIGLGRAAVQSGRLPDSEALYSRAMTSARQMGDRRLEAQAIEGMAWLEQQKRNFEGADILFTRVLNRYNQIGDKHGAAAAALGQAFVARRTGQFEDANEMYDEAADAHQEGGDLLGVARAITGQATVLQQLGNLDEAEHLYRQAMGIAEDLGANDLMMEARLGLGDLSRIQGGLERAEAIYEGHAAWAERQGVFEGSIFAHMGLASVALAREDLMGMYNQTNLAVQYLNKVPGHWLWAAYRLLVATMLAMRKDEEQTYRWLWNANELGLSDTVDLDFALNLLRIFEIACNERWVNVIRVAGKLAIGQCERLGKKTESRGVKRRMNEILS
jgi:eukaryotic-like serine/threonine-protein kinase